MTVSNHFDQNNDNFSAKKTGKVVVLRFKGNPLLNSAIVKDRDAVLDYFDLVSSSDAIQVVVLLNQSKRSPRETYCEFYKMIFSTQYWVNSLFKMYRTFDQIILRIVESDKFFISADNGNIIPQIFNVSLACDYRIIANDAVFENAPLELGPMPKGGGAFFLSRLLGSVKTYDLLLSDREVRADEALNLGIVNQVVSYDDLEAVALATAQYYAEKPATSLSGIKRIVNYTAKDLKKYLEFENEQLLRTMGLSHLTS